MSNPVRPHSQQPTRLPRPWDSPSKNAGVGCHFRKFKDIIGAPKPNAGCSRKEEKALTGPQGRRRREDRGRDWSDAPQLSLRHACVVVLSCFSRVRLFATPWTAARQAPLSVGFSRHECCSGLPCPSLGNLPNLGVKPSFLHILH